VFVTNKRSGVHVELQYFRAEFDWIWKAILKNCLFFGMDYAW